MEDYEQTFEEFWKDLVTDSDGNLDPDAVKRELHDFHALMGNVTEVYVHVTGGRISKPLTEPFEVNGEADNRLEEARQEAAEEAADEALFRAATARVGP